MAETKLPVPVKKNPSLPVIIEVIFTLSKLTVTLTGIIVIVVTFINGNPYWVALLRGGITVLSLGLLLWFISWIVTKGVIESVREMVKESQGTNSRITGGRINNKA